MLKLLTVSFLLSTALGQSFLYATDINQLGTSSSFSCLRSNGYSTIFTRAYKPDGSGSVDYNAVQNVNMAYSAGLGIEVYMTPNPTSSKAAYTQVDEAINTLTSGGMTIRSLWIQVTSPVNWSSSQTTNNNFINSAIQRIRSRGIRPGVYTNTYDWQQITNAATNTGSDVMLWYWNVYGQGTGGETPANFNDFRSFGPWNNAAVKQFGQNEAICGFTANRDVYPASSIRANGKKEKTIVVGQIGL